MASRVKIPRREPSPFIKLLRSFFFARTGSKSSHRYADQMAVPYRNQAPPNLPDGSAHRLSANYYYTRDTRRRILPPQQVPVLTAADTTTTSATAAIDSGKKSKKQKKTDVTAESAVPQTPTPGAVYLYGDHNK